MARGSDVRSVESRIPPHQRALLSARRNVRKPHHHARAWYGRGTAISQGQPRAFVGLRPEERSKWIRSHGGRHFWSRPATRRTDNEVLDAAGREIVLVTLITVGWLVVVYLLVGLCRASARGDRELGPSQRFLGSTPRAVLRRDATPGAAQGAGAFSPVSPHPKPSRVRRPLRHRGAGSHAWVRR